ncbi:MAG: pyruvate:ferredoxin (flavodoxin) oxidoreductase [Clostridiales bacterium]|jgi:pyruvate-ferredoxin/flavodoxin oxidoreductase|nr:pyruvate:ferredoxin (flavodoxin) oxidoreductase [Clostridiales bacterium]
MNKKKMQTMDGNTAAAYVSYAFTEVAGIYPITPSSAMAETTDVWAAKGRTNMFGHIVRVQEMQSEGGAAGVIHGSLQAGALTTTYTASQGLLLMIPNMYKIAGELLPCVIHVSARALAGHALSIFGDHSDIMAVRQTGFAILASSAVHEAMDLGAVAHLATLKARVPFVHFFDGFRTSHELQKISVLDYEDLHAMTDHEAIREFRARALNPEHPVTRGTAQNPDIFFQGKEAANRFYDATPGIVEEYMQKINELTGKNYNLFDYYGPPDATKIIVAMGSASGTIKEVVDFLGKKGEKVGFVVVRLFRPFSAQHLIRAIPETVKKIAVLDRCKEPGSLGEPLYQDVCTAVHQMGRAGQYEIVGGRYGLGSKDVTPAQILAVYENLDADKPKTGFTVGIVDDVTHLSLEVGEEIAVTPEGTTNCKFWGIGGDGTVGASENSIKIIGDHTNKFVQGYMTMDSKKTSGLTTTHLRFGDTPIRSTYLVKTADFVACHNEAYIHQFDILGDLKAGGVFLYNCHHSPEELDAALPNRVKRALAQKNVEFYVIDAGKIARSLGLGHRVNTVLQAAFFKLTEIIPIEDAVKYMKEANFDSYAKRGQKVVDMNNAAVDAGLTGFVKVDVPPAWANLPDDEIALADPIVHAKGGTDFIENVVFPIITDKGNDLPVSTFVGREDGTFPQGTSAFEKRGIAAFVPNWIPENCIDCNLCSYVCPHAVIRPFLLNEAEIAAKPDGFKTKPTSIDGHELSIQLSALDCTGCTSCVKVCPGKKGQKALEMLPLEPERGYAQMANWYAALALSPKENPMTIDTVRGSQYNTPLLEFSGACAGCGETPYAKLITQLFGDRMYIANATGCSSIWGASAPSTPYTTNHRGHGPAWANSLFEDAAEFGMGMHLAISERRKKLAAVIAEIVENSHAGESLKSAAKTWLEHMDCGEKSAKASEALLKAIESLGDVNPELAALFDHVRNNNDMLRKKSTWIFGGDGWAYDIGYGGLDHVLASGENINVLVFDTEVYSNTGGQSSKSTPTAAVAKFAAGGKKIRKKDLGLMAINYGYVYVAQVAMGANYSQLLKAVLEAEAHDGPSLIIAYSPCIAQGIDMTNTQNQMKRAVEAGYWHLYRYNPALIEAGENPFVLDSKPPTGDFIEYLRTEGRYNALKIAFPDIAEDLFEQAKIDAQIRYANYEQKAQNK